MRLGIMQPYFLPSLGYFDLIRHTDRWVVFDTAQYRRHSWMNRNRILHPTEGWHYVIARLAKHSRNTPIRDVRLHPDPSWRARILGQITHYKRKAPHYRFVEDLLRRCLSWEGDRLDGLCVHALRVVCEALEISFEPEIFSEMNLDLPEVDDPGGWALEIASALGAAEYVNPPGGRALFDPERFRERGITLTIREFEDLVYPVPGGRFEPTLSIIDVLMWVSPEEVGMHLAAQSG